MELLSILAPFPTLVAATGGLITATAAVRSAMQQLFDVCIHRLLKIGDDGAELAGGQAVLTGGAGGIRLFEPAQRCVNRFATARAVQGNRWFDRHGFVLLGCRRGFQIVSRFSIAERGLYRPEEKKTDFRFPESRSLADVFLKVSAALI